MMTCTLSAHVTRRIMNLLLSPKQCAISVYHIMGKLLPQEQASIFSLSDGSFYFSPSKISWLGARGASVRFASNLASLATGAGLLKSFGPASRIC